MKLLVTVPGGFGHAPSNIDLDDVKRIKAMAKSKPFLLIKLKWPTDKEFFLRFVRFTIR